MPNFIIIGAPRSGTTSLYEGIKQHPEIYMSPVKEPYFFALTGESEPWHGPEDNQGVRDIDDYRALFNGVRDEKAFGEASTVYLYSSKACNLIKQYLPDVKLIAILRNPADRAYSNFIEHVQHGREPLSNFEAALDAEEERIKLGWSPFWFYKRMGFYNEQLTRYMENFSSQQIKIFLYEDLKSEPRSVFKKMFQFLGVDETFTPELYRHNASGIPKSRVLHALLTRQNPVKTVLKPFFPKGIRQRIQKVNLARAPRLSQETRNELIQEYRKDILMLQDLIQRDLSNWLT